MTSTYSARRPSRSEFITLRGLRYHVHAWGQPGPEPTLVLAHGWMDVGASYQFMVDALARERHVLAFDWRGFGLTEAPGADSYWFPDYLGDLDALIDHYSPHAPVDLVGHSMGGNVAMFYAGVRPQRVRRLANLEGFGVPQTQAEQAPQRLAQWLDELKTEQTLKDYASLDEVAARLRKTNPLLPADKANWLAPHWARRNAAGRYEILGDPAHRRVNPVLSRAEETLATWRCITAPVLWVQGSLSQPEKWWQGRYTLAEFEQRLRVVAQVQRHTLGPAGHMLHHDQPEALAQVLEAFLSA